MNTVGGLKHAYLDDLNGAIQQKPLAAALIGLGLIGMFVSRRGLVRMTTPLPGLAKSAAAGVGGAAGSGIDQLRSGASAAMDAAESVKEGVGERAKRLAAALTPASQSEDSAPNSPNEQGSPSSFQSIDVGFAAVRQKVGDACEQQPLLIGLAGLAVGAVVAAAFKPTTLEQDVLGESAASLREQAGAAVAEAKSRAARAAQAMQDEARARGLTASDAQAELKATAQKATQAAKATFSGSSPEE
jgi:hypothetical protein